MGRFWVLGTLILSYVVACPVLAATQVTVTLSGAQSVCEKHFLPLSEQNGAHTFSLHSRRISLDVRMTGLQITGLPRLMGVLARKTAETTLHSMFPGGRIHSTVGAVPGLNSPGFDRLTLSAEADGSLTAVSEQQYAVGALASQALGPLQHKHSLSFDTSTCSAPNSLQSVCHFTQGSWQEFQAGQHVSFEVASDHHAPFGQSVNTQLGEEVLQEILNAVSRRYGIQQGAAAGFHTVFHWRALEPAHFTGTRERLTLTGPRYEVTITISSNRP